MPSYGNNCMFCNKPIRKAIKYCKECKAKPENRKQIYASQIKNRRKVKQEQPKKVEVPQQKIIPKNMEKKYCDQDLFNLKQIFEKYLLKIESFTSEKEILERIQLEAEKFNRNSKRIAESSRRNQATTAQWMEQDRKDSTFPLLNLYMGKLGTGWMFAAAFFTLVGALITALIQSGLPENASNNIWIILGAVIVSLVIGFFMGKSTVGKPLITKNTGG